MKIKSYTKRIVGDVPKEYPQQIFNQLLAFQGYGFNECIDIHSTVELRDGTKKELKDVMIDDEIKSANSSFCHLYKNKLECISDLNNIIYVKVKNIYHNNKNLYEITTNLGKKIISSLDHKFKVTTLSNYNHYEMKHLYEILDVDNYNSNHNNELKEYYLLVTEDGLETIDYDNIRPCGNLPTIDLEVNDENHQFFANGILVSNSHSVAYSLYSAVDLFFKAHYPKEFICCYINQCSRTDEIEGINAIKYLINYARKKGIHVFKPDINESQDKWIIYNNGFLEGLLFPLRDMMLLNNLDIKSIIDNRPYKNFEDFYQKVGNKMNEKKLQHLICSEAFNKFGDVDLILTEYLSLKGNKGSDQLDLFASFDDIVSDVPILSKQQQKQYQEEMLNYTFEKTLQDEFDKYIQEYNKKAKENNFTRLRTLGEIEDSNVKFTLIIAKVLKTVVFTPKNGGVNKVWVFLTDGLYNAKLMISEDDLNGSYSHYFKSGNVLQIPVAVSDQSRNVFFLNKNASNAEIKLLKQG